MNTSLSGLLAIEVRPHTSGEWVATYYPVVGTAHGRMAEITLELHQHTLPAGPGTRARTTWLEADSPDPAGACYAAHPGWAARLAAGYAAALAVYDTETIDAPSSLEDPGRLRRATALVAPGQLPEWVLTEARHARPEKVRPERVQVLGGFLAGSGAEATSGPRATGA